MKKLGVLLVVLLFLSGITYAQERGGETQPSKTVGQGTQGGTRGDRIQMNSEQIVKRQTQRLVDELVLTKEQEAKVFAINKKYMDKSSGDIKKMRAASNDERLKMRDEMQKNQTEKNKEIKAVLTPAQVKLYDENQKKRAEIRQNGQGRKDGRGGLQ